MAGILVLAFAVGCGSADEGGGTGAAAAAQVADLSQFPTPTRSQATPQPEPTQQVTAAQAQSQASQDDESEGEAAEVAPMTQEELRELRDKMRSGQLSEDEMAEAVQRLRAQFGGGQGGGGFGGGGGSQAVGSIDSISGSTITVTTETRHDLGERGRERQYQDHINPRTDGADRGRSGHGLQ